MMGRLTVFVMAAVLALPLAAAAHPGHDHKLMGTLSSIDAKKLVMKTKEGKDVTVAVTATTKFLNGKSRGAGTELKAGMRVVVNVGDGKEPLVAKEVQYSTAASTSHGGQSL
jgi:hypothetical protein